MNKRSFIKLIWNDSVWSKVISVGIVALITYIVTIVSGLFGNYTVKQIKAPPTVPAVKPPNIPPESPAKNIHQEAQGAGNLNINNETGNVTINSNSRRTGK